MRLIDWQTRLVAYLADVQGRPFVPGQLDCALFAAGAVEAMTGENIAAEFGRYSTIRGGLRVLRRRGFADQVALVEARFAEVAPSFAQAGDLAVVDGDFDLALGVVQGEWIYVMRPDGLGLVSLLEAKRAFRV